MPIGTNELQPFDKQNERINQVAINEWAPAMGTAREAEMIIRQLAENIAWPVTQTEEAAKKALDALNISDAAVEVTFGLADKMTMDVSFEVKVVIENCPPHSKSFTNSLLMNVENVLGSLSRHIVYEDVTSSYDKETQTLTFQEIFSLHSGYPASS